MRRRGHSHRADLCGVALSTLWRVQPYRWRLLSPTTAPSALDTVLATPATLREAQAAMTVTHNGGTFSYELMATDGTLFITASQRATLVSMPPILVADQPSSIGETVPSGTCPVILSSTGSGVKSERRLVL